MVLFEDFEVVDFFFCCLWFFELEEFFWIEGDVVWVFCKGVGGWWLF